MMSMHGHALIPAQGLPYSVQGTGPGKNLDSCRDAGLYCQHLGFAVRAFTMTSLQDDGGDSSV